MLINEECGNSEVVVDGRELLTERRSQAFYKPVDVHSVRNAIGESISSTRIWNIGNQLGKYVYSYGSVVNNLRETQRFSD